MFNQSMIKRTSDIINKFFVFIFACKAAGRLIVLEFIKMVLISLCVIVLIMLGIRKLSDVCDLTGLFRKDKSGRGKRR